MFFEVIETLYTFISNSNMRYQLYTEAQRALSMPILELERNVQTRWSYRYQSVSKVKLRFEEIVATPTTISKSHDASAAEAKDLGNPNL